MTLDDVMELAGREQFLGVVATLRDDSTIQSSLVNAGVLDHPVTGARCTFEAPIPEDLAALFDALRAHRPVQRGAR